MQELLGPRETELASPGEGSEGSGTAGKPDTDKPEQEQPHSSTPRDRPATRRTSLFERRGFERQTAERRFATWGTAKWARIEATPVGFSKPAPGSSAGCAVERAASDRSGHSRTRVASAAGQGRLMIRANDGPLSCRLSEDHG